MTKDTNANHPVTDQDKILVWAKTFWRERKIFIKCLLFFGTIGLFIAMLSPKEYISRTSMVPQTSKAGSKLSGISSLAAMAGFNLDLSNGEELSPAVYPQIVSSVPFQLDLMNTPFHFSKVAQPVTLYTYYTDIEKQRILHLIGEYTIGLPEKVIAAIRGDNHSTATYPGRPIFLTKKQEKIRKLIEKQVTLDVDIKFGFLTLQSTFSEAELSAEVADQARELLQQYITRCKIKKATDQLLFIDDRYQEKKKEFQKTQENLARFRDQNKNVSSALAATEEEQLRSEYTIAQSVYNELAKQLEQAKIQVKEDTPVFSIIQPATVPQNSAKPKRIMVLTIWLILGGIIGVGIIFGKQYLIDIKKKWAETD